jgi:hypothetical protein
MSHRRLFHLRKQANAVHRFAIRRSYASSSELEPEEDGRDFKTPQEEINFLRSQELTVLAETTASLNAVMAAAKKLENRIAGAPTTINFPFSTSETGSVPPYTIGYMRDRARKMQERASEVYSTGDNVRQHLADLMVAPYKEPENEIAKSVTEWREKMDRMTEAEREDVINNMKLQEEGDAVRMLKECQQIFETVKKIEEAKLNAGSKRATNPFGGDESSKMPTKDEAITESTPSLADLQKQLETSEFSAPKKR